METNPMDAEKPAMTPPQITEEAVTAQYIHDCLGRAAELRDWTPRICKAEIYELTDMVEGLAKRLAERALAAPPRLSRCYMPGCKQHAALNEFIDRQDAAAPCKLTREQIAEVIRKTVPSKSASLIYPIADEIMRLIEVDSAAQADAGASASNPRS